MLRFENPIGLFQSIISALSEISGSPGLIGLNMAVGIPTLTFAFLFSWFIWKRGKLLWALGLSVVLAGALYFYFWQYPPGEYYKEADVPPGQFAHMVLFMMFPLLPLLTLLAYAASAVWAWR